MTVQEINEEFDYLITPPNFTVAEHLNFGSRSVVRMSDRVLLVEDFRKLTKTQQQFSLTTLFVLQAVREKYGKPIFITCGYRSLRHELSKGRSGKSKHTESADDFTADNMGELVEACGDWPGGFCYYPDNFFCHGDVGPYRRWNP